MDKKYWTSFYENHGRNTYRSNFAAYVVEHYRPELKLIFDVGCGDGRDSFFFAENGIPCIGVDQCAVQHDSASGIESSNPLLSFIKDDFTTISYEELGSTEFAIYSRFTLHALNYGEEDCFFNNLMRCNSLKLLFIEARSIRDKLYGQGKEVGPHEFVTSHYRRFLDPDALRSRLEQSFIVEHFEEGTGFSPVPMEDPCLIRVVARRP